MSYITFDYRCSSCDSITSRMVKREEMDEQRCEACLLPVVKLPAGTRTTFRFNDSTLKD